MLAGFKLQTPASITTLPRPQEGKHNLRGEEKDETVQQLRCGQAPRVSRRSSSWSWARHGRCLKVIALIAPAGKKAGSAARPLQEQQHYEYDCGILGGASRETPRLP